MRPADLTSFLKEAIPAKHSILITGAPGIGKSEIVDDAAAQADADVIISHPAVSDPTDAKGLPWATQDATEATFLPFGELARALRAEKLTVWFLDDLGQASAAVQASYMQLLLARRVNGHVLPDHVTFVAATNRRTDRAGVSGILEPVKSRFTSIVQLEANLDDWTRWAFTHNIPAELIAFLRFRPDLLSAFEASADLTNSPSPRTWSSVAKLLALNLSQGVRHEALAGAVGAGAAVEFTAFLNLYKTLPNIDAILVDPDSQPLPESPATLFAVTTGLGLKANQTVFPRLARYAQRLLDASRGEFAALLLRDSIRRDPTVVQTPSYVKLIVSDLGQLMSGAPVK